MKGGVLLMIWAGISAIIGIVKLLLAEKKLGALGLIRKEKVCVFKLLFRRQAGNFTSQRLNPFAVGTTL